MIMFFKSKLKEEFMSPKKLSEELHKFYMSDFLLSQLREFYSYFERRQFFSAPAKPVRAKDRCESDFPICYGALDHLKQSRGYATRIFKCEDLFRNFKADYFTRKQLLAAPKPPGPDCLDEERPPGCEEDLMIERQVHICECKNEDARKLQVLKRTDYLKEISNNTLNTGSKRFSVSGSSFYSPRYQKSYQDSFLNTRKYSANLNQQTAAAHRLFDKQPTGSSGSWKHGQQENDPADYRNGRSRRVPDRVQHRPRRR
jgi:hypothetical protein